MASITKYAGTISQVTGGKYCSFNNLNNIKNSTTGSYATSNGRIKGKNSSPNRPSTISLTNFGFQLPTGAEVTKVTVNYRHRKEKYNNHVCNIPAPTISLLGVSGFSGKGSAPTTTLTTFSKSFTGKALTRTIVNSSSFGVKIDYPTNTNSYEGSMSISLVNIVITYKTSEYSLNLKKASGGYNEEDYVLEASISNKNFTSYNPSLTLSAPAGFSFQSGSGTGEFTRVNNRTIIWNPKLTSKVGTSTCRFVFDTNVTFPTGVDAYTGTFTLVESLNSTTKNYTATIQHRPSGTSEETAPDSPPVITDDDISPVPLKWDRVKVNEDITVYDSRIEDARLFAFPVNIDGEVLLLEEDSPIRMTYNGDKLTKYYSSSDDYHGARMLGFIGTQYYSSEPGKFCIIVYDNNNLDRSYWSYWNDKEPVITYFFEVIPNEEDLTTPYFSILEPSEEELNRLGDGYPYIVQSDIKNTTTDNYTRDWYKNNRIGVYNNEIIGVDDYTTLTNEQIYTNAQYWSDDVAGLNTYNNVECEFTYNDDYPLYILITGDYPEATTYGYDVGTVSFTEPCIIEKEVYSGREETGNYPVPIRALIDSLEEDMSTITLPANEVGTSVRLYEFPLDEGYGTNEDMAIRGIQVDGTIESTDNIIINAKLQSPTGEMGQRSIVLTEDDELSIGGLGDLWGFNVADLTSLGDWELEFSTSNLLNNSESTLQLKDITVTFYIEQIERQEVSVSINGEPLEYYGCFIEEVKIPEGLNTNTAYINVDGTDINDAYRQNIKEKEIELKFNISACDLKTSTDMLRQVTKLLINEKDQYNRPIPNTVTFTHYPNDYFEYILENTLEVTSEVTGYNVTAKLTIPAGTSYSIDDTVTNVVGYANGLAAINPIITLQPSSSNIEVRETLSGQSFNIGFSGDWNNKIVEIDCIDRRVYLKDNSDDEGTDISKYVDHNADWFRLSGEYSFEGINCIIRTVTFNERW